MNLRLRHLKGPQRSGRTLLARSAVAAAFLEREVLFTPPSPVSLPGAQKRRHGARTRAPAQVAPPRKGGRQHRENVGRPRNT